MLATLTSLALAPVVWYGPSSVAFDASFPGNPYDPVANDIQVEFSGPKGRKERRLAYFDGKQWRATLLTSVAGSYRARLVRNGVQVAVPETTVKPVRRKGDGFIRLDGKGGFAYESGRRYWPMGPNVAWTNSEVPDLPAELVKLGKNGVNWARIWACHWDGKNPFWPNEGPKPEIGWMDPKIFAKWDSIVRGADQAGVGFQFVLFHHGPYSSRVNSNWGEHPWNAKNGGFLKTPSDFFTDPKAKALARAWLRYVVARYGHEPSIMAWELFNEVEWCDPFYENRGAIVGEWHDEIATYLRSIDPYRRLITTSSEIHLPIYRKVDFYQPHGYPANITAMILGFEGPKDKPVFYGEFGLGDNRQDREAQAQALRDGVYAGLFAGHAGAGQYWYWDNVAKYDLYRYFAFARKAIDSSGILAAGDRRRFRPVLDAGRGGDLEFAPGAGWTKTTRFEFRLPDDLDALGGFSAYLQGTGHREMTARPVRFQFNLPQAGSMAIRFAGVSAGGGNLKVRVNGRLVSESLFPGNAKPADVSVPLPAGEAEVELWNDGPDWVQLAGFRVPGIAERATAYGTGNKENAFVRVLVAANATPPARVALKGLPLAAGRARVTVTNLLDGKTVASTGTVVNGELVGGVVPLGREFSVSVRRQGNR